jgi:hypothetical protein
MALSSSHVASSHLPRQLARLATVAALGSFVGTALALDPPKDPEIPAGSISVDDAHGLLVVAVDRDKRFADAPPSVTVTSVDQKKSVVLADDGAGADGKAGDGVWVGVMTAPPTGHSVDLSLADGTGTEIWRDLVPISAQLDLPRVDFVVVGDHVKTTLSTVSKDTIEASGAPSDAGPTGGLSGGPSGPPSAGGAPPAPGTQGTAPAPSGGGLPPPPPGTHGAPLPSGVTSGAGLIVAGLLGLMGVLAGGVIGLLVGRRGARPVELERVGGRPAARLPPGMPPTVGAQQAWLVANPAELAEVTRRVTVHLAQVGPVVLATDPGQQAELSTALVGTMGVVSHPEEHPPPHALLEAAMRLRCFGRPSILIAGPAGVESPDTGEEPDAVLAELLEDAEESVDIVVLMPQGEWPLVQLRAEVHLTADGGLRFVHLQTDEDDADNNDASGVGGSNGDAPEGGAPVSLASGREDAQSDALKEDATLSAK